MSTKRDAWLGVERTRREMSVLSRTTQEANASEQRLAYETRRMGFEQQDALATAEGKYETAFRAMEHRLEEAHKQSLANMKSGLDAELNAAKQRSEELEMRMEVAARAAAHVRGGNAQQDVFSTPVPTRGASEVSPDLDTKLAFALREAEERQRVNQDTLTNKLHATFGAFQHNVESLAEKVNESDKRAEKAMTKLRDRVTFRDTEHKSTSGREGTSALALNESNRSTEQSRPAGAAFAELYDGQGNPIEAKREEVLSAAPVPVQPQGGWDRSPDETAGGEGVKLCHAPRQHPNDEHHEPVDHGLIGASTTTTYTRTATAVGVSDPRTQTSGGRVGRIMQDIGMSAVVGTMKAMFGTPMATNHPTTAAATIGIMMFQKATAAKKVRKRKTTPRGATALVLTAIPMLEVRPPLVRINPSANLPVGRQVAVGARATQATETDLLTNTNV